MTELIFMIIDSLEICCISLNGRNIHPVVTRFLNQNALNIHTAYLKEIDNLKPWQQNMSYFLVYRVSIYLPISISNI